MLRRLGSHIRNQWAGFLSLFLVLTGGIAYAANTIGSADIIDGSILSADVKNGQVTKDDLADNAVRTAKVLDESLTGHDIQDNTIGGADVNESLLNPLTSPQIKDESLTGHDIQDNTIGGADVNESLLDDVFYTPAFSTWDPPDFHLPSNGSDAQVIYTGDGDHGDPLVHVRVPGLVMATASLNFIKYDEHTQVTCGLGLVKPGGGRTPFGIPATETITENVDEVGHTSIGFGSLSLTGTTSVANPGDYYVNVVCRSLDFDPRPGASYDEATFDSGSLIAWAT